MTESNRTPRELVPSPSLLRALERCEATSVKGVRGKRRARRTLSLSRLAQLEKQIDARLHDDVLTLLAIGDPIVKLVTGIEDVLSIEDAADEDSDEFEDDGHLLIASVYSEPIAELLEGVHGGPYLALVTSRQPQGPQAMIGETSLGEFIDEMLDAARTAGLDGFDTCGRLASAKPLQPAARLVAGKTRAEKSLGRVDHKKFGPGTILQRIGDGDTAKFVIAFEDHERTVLARFVKVID